VRALAPGLDKILVINPNSTGAVTRGIDEACAPLREATQKSVLGIPVVEPTQAAVAMAIGRVRLNWAGN